MIKLIFLITVIFSSNLFASYPYQNFDSNKLKISPISYTRYVRPQINSIVNDFYKMIKSSLDDQGELVSIYKGLKITINKSRYPEDFKKIYDLIITTEKKLLRFQNKHTNYDNKNINHQLKLDIQLNKITNITYNLLHKFEWGMSLDEEELQAYISNVNIKREIDELIIYMKLVLMTCLPENLQDQFQFVYFNFISPLEEHIYKRKKYGPLVSRLEDLNMTWNTFNMRLTKGNMKVSSPIKQGLKMIHARWVSILKVLLKRSLRDMI